MAAKGESKTQKKISVAKVAKIKRKGSPTFIVRVPAGPHSADTAVPLAVVIRDLLHLAENMHEVKAILNEKKALVDGRVAKDPRLAVGFMDVVSFPTVSKYYRMVYDYKGRLEPKEIDAKDSTIKLCKVQTKTVTKGGKMQIGLHDGKSLLSDKKCGRGDVIKLELPTLKVLEVFPLSEGNVAYITGGTHAGQVAAIKSIVPGTMMRKPLALLEGKDGAFQTRKDYVFVLGTKAPAVKM